MSQGEKNVQSDRGSNPGPLAYRVSALPIELSGCLTHYLRLYRDIHPHKFESHPRILEVNFMAMHLRLTKQACMVPCLVPNVTG